MTLTSAGTLLQVLLAAGLWFFERMIEHGGDLFGSISDGDMGIWLAWWASFLLLPFSFGLAVPGNRLNKRHQRDRSA